tara:strand:- start:151 stop:561 length:411 start_codon:yes stop_codon:yes gene_type:complete
MGIKIQQVVLDKLFQNKTKLSKKVELAYREQENDDASGEFQSYRGELDFILKNKLPDAIRILEGFLPVIEEQEAGLYRLIDLYKDTESYYEKAADELGIEPRSIDAYMLLSTDIFRAEEQLEIVNDLKSQLNNFNL